MEVKIPNLFWYAVSYAIIALTTGLLLISWRSGNVSVQIADTKIQLSGTIAEVKDASISLEAREKDLAARQILFNEHIQKVEAASRAANIPVPVLPKATIIPHIQYQDFRDKLNNAQRSISNSNSKD